MLFREMQIGKKPIGTVWIREAVNVPEIYDLFNKPVNRPGFQAFCYCYSKKFTFPLDVYAATFFTMSLN